MLSINFNKKIIEENKHAGDGAKKDPYYFTFFNEKNDGDKESKKDKKKSYMNETPIHETSIHTDNSSELTPKNSDKPHPLKPQLKSKSQRENT
jgi:hypothetical protein